MSEYVKTFTYCKNEIQMSDKEGRWLPYNKDGGTHDCKKKNGKQEITLEAIQKKCCLLRAVLNFSMHPSMQIDRYLLIWLRLL